MNRKPLPPDSDIKDLAKRLKALWASGQSVRPFFRQHAALFRELQNQGWSWAGLALVLNKAKITYRTGKPWTADALLQAFSRAQVPLRQRKLMEAGRSTEFDKNPTNVTKFPLPEPQQAGIVQLSPAVEAVSQPPATPTPTAKSFPESRDTSESEFKFIRFIDWDERRSATNDAPVSAPPQLDVAASDATSAHSQHYIEIMEQLTGKKPSF